ncbi:Uncharacterised protein [Shigella sonnei]|nr:Uncharacterised protein [Shigella sonnei]
MQTKRQQQTFTGTKQHRSEITRAVYHMAQAANTHRENRPD